MNYSALTDGASEGVSPLLILKTVEGLIPPGGFTPPSTPIPAYRDSEIPLHLCQDVHPDISFPMSSLLFGCLPSTCFGLACQRWDTHLVTGSLRALPTWRGFHPTRRLHRERREDVIIIAYLRCLRTCGLSSPPATVGVFPPAKR